MPLVNELVAVVANCEALPRLFIAVCTEARLGVIPDVNDPILGKADKLAKEPMPLMLVRFEVRPVNDGSPCAHCAVSCVPNRLELATKLPIWLLTLLVKNDVAATNGVVAPVYTTPRTADIDCAAGVSITPAACRLL